VQLELPSRNRLPGESPEPEEPRKQPKMSKETPKKGADNSHGTEKRRLKHDDDGGSSSAKKRRHSSEERQRPPQQKGGNNSTEKKRNSTEERQRPQQQGGSNSSTKQQQRKFAPFRELLKGVVFTISGFQNPLRGNIRDKALGRLKKLLFDIFFYA
jgi:DNA-repair protein XRCC1